MAHTTFEVKKAQLEVSASRVYKATPERLWQALTIPEQILQWWGPGSLSTVIEKNELTVGGAWRYIHTSPDGTVHAFRGVYKQLEAPHKIVRSFEYEPMAGHVLTETMSLEVVGDGMTKMTTTAHYDTLEDLEGMVSMGMESGERESLERLAVLVEGRS